MFSEKVAGDKRAPFEHPFGDHARPFLEQIRRDALEPDGHFAFRVMDNECHRHAVGRAENAVLGDHATKTDRATLRNAIAGDVLGRVEVTRTVANSRHGQHARPQHRAEPRQRQDQSLMLGFHRCAAFSAARIDSHAHSVTAVVPPSVTT